MLKKVSKMLLVLVIMALMASTSMAEQRIMVFAGAASKPPT